MRALRYFSDVNTSGGGPEWSCRDDLCVDSALHLRRYRTYVTCRHDLEEGVAYLDGRRSPRRRPCVERLIMDPWPDRPYHHVRVEQSFSKPWPCDGRCVRVGRDDVIVGAAVMEVRALLRSSGDGSVPAHLWARRFASAYHHREAHCSEFCVDQRVHVTRRFAEYGPQATFPSYENVRPCDGSCRYRTVRLPRQAQRLIARYQSAIARPHRRTAAPDDVQRAYAQATSEAEGFADTLEMPHDVARPSVAKVPTPAPRDAEWFRKLAFWQTLGLGFTDAEIVRDLHARYGADAWLEVASEGVECRVTIPVARIGVHARIQELQAEFGWFAWSAFDEDPKTELLIRRLEDFGDEPWWRIVCCREQYDLIDGLWVHPLISERNPALIRRAVELLDLAPSVSVQSYVPYGHLTNEEVEAMRPASCAPRNEPIGEDTFSDG